MPDYLLLKYLHIVAATIVAGTGIGIAYFMLMASRTQNSEVMAAATRHVVLADWLFTAPAVATQLITGLLLMDRLGYAFSSRWFYWVISVFVVIGLCWLPVLRIQYRLRDLANASVDGVADWTGIRHLMRLWFWLGVPAFGAILVLFWLMIFKPFPVT